MKASSKKRNPLLKGRISYLSRSKTELVGLVAPADSAEIAWKILEHTEILLAQFAFRTERHTLPDDLPVEAAAEFLRGDAVRGFCGLIVASGDARLPRTLAGAARSSAVALPIIRVPLATPELSGTVLLQPLLDPAPAEAGAADGGGVVFATMAIGEAGAKNAALLVVAIVAAAGDRQMHTAWDNFRTRQTQAVFAMPLPRAGASDVSRVVRRAQ